MIARQDQYVGRMEGKDIFRTFEETAPLDPRLQRLRHPATQFVVQWALTSDQEIPIGPLSRDRDKRVDKQVYALFRYKTTAVKNVAAAPTQPEFSLKSFQRNIVVPGKGVEIGPI